MILGEMKFEGVNRSGARCFEASMALKIRTVGLYPEEGSSMLVRKTLNCRDTRDNQTVLNVY